MKGCVVGMSEEGVYKSTRDEDGSGQMTEDEASEENMFYGCLSGCKTLSPASTTIYAGKERAVHRKNKVKNEDGVIRRLERYDVKTGIEYRSCQVRTVCRRVPMTMLHRGKVMHSPERNVWLERVASSAMEDEVR